MRKYLTIFEISFQQEFAYKLNFVMWRVRNVLQVLITYFLWTTIFSDPSRIVFGYDRAKILTYIFGLIVVRAIVLSSRTIDVAGEVSQGLLTNYLLKPMSYIKYWFTRDISSKALNLAFSIFEATILFLILKPEFFLQTNVALFSLFVASLLIAVVLFFFLMFIANMLPLWLPEQPWSMSFLLFIFTDFLGGGVFPLDILPDYITKLIYLTPFPYLLFMPLQIYLGKLDVLSSLNAVLTGGVWVILLAFITKAIWTQGLKSYGAVGR